MRCISLPNLALAITVAATLCACGGNGGIASSSGLPGVRASQSKIKHVIIIVQENRSFNNLFNGYPGAKTQSYGYDSSGKKVELQPIGLATKWDLEHNGNGFFAACNGRGNCIRERTAA